jgi:hypothetical protein
MQHGLTIAIVDVDPDYLGSEIHASNDRFAGTTWIYAGLTELGEFAAQVAVFPSNTQDERNYEFGTPDPGIAGGYCKLSFQCIDRARHVRHRARGYEGGDKPVCRRTRDGTIPATALENPCLATWPVSPLPSAPATDATG